MSKRVFQVVIGTLGLIPVVTGLLGFLGLRNPLYARFGVVPNVVLDSNLRFYGGLWLGAGITLYVLLKDIEKHPVVFRTLCGMIFLGGIGRVVSWMDAGAPSPRLVGIIGLELVGTPLLALWHRRLARSLGETPLGLRQERLRSHP